jgi:hypothetical protein
MAEITAVLPSLNAIAGESVAPWWAAGLLAVAIVILFALGSTRFGRAFGAVAGYSVILVATLVAWTYLDRMGQRDRAEERRALDARAMELTARALAPGSPLSCLDAAAGDAVETACEKALFASPEAIAAALSYVSARLSLLADALAYATRDPSYEDALSGLRRAAEIDRYGMVAHLLATRDGCTADACAAYAWLRDASVVKANLKGRTYENYVSRNVANWTAGGAAMAAADGRAPEPAAKPASSLIDFPSAESIPRVSIMNAEPAAPTDGAAPAARSAAAQAERPARTPLPLPNPARVQ